VKLRIDRDAFADAVAWAARSLPSRPAVPVLAGLLLDAAAAGVPLDASPGADAPAVDTLTLSGFDYETATRVGLAADVDEPGRVLVPGKLLADISKSLPAAPVDLSTEDNRLVVRCGPARFALTLLPQDDYPELPPAPPVSGTVPAAAFAEAVAQVAIAAGRDDMLPVLTGIQVEITGDRLRLLATDRYRLAVRDLTWTPADPDATGSALVPARVLSDAAKAMAGGGVVSLSFPLSRPTGTATGVGAPVGGLIGLSGGTATAPRSTTTRLLDGEYPKVMSLFPAEAPITSRVSTARLLESARRVSLVADRNAPIRLGFDGSELTLDAGSGEDAQATEVVEAVTDGEAISVGFFPGYLVDGLQHLGGSTAQFSFTHPTKAVVITGASGPEEESDPDYRYLVMPRRLPG